LSWTRSILLVESVRQTGSMTAKSGRVPDSHDRAVATFRRGEFVRVAGSPSGYNMERKLDTRRIDHLTILIRAGIFGTIEIALNTYSLRSLNAGHNPRIRVAVLSSHWTALPPAGVSRSGGFNFLSFRGAHATRVLVSATRRNELVWALGVCSACPPWRAKAFLKVIGLDRAIWLCPGWCPTLKEELP
jgi:hypothetical protein